MEDLLWFSGITWDTPLNEIGWAYVVIGGLVLVMLYLLVKIAMDW